MFSPLSPKLRLFGVDYYWSFEAQKMVFGPALVLSKHVQSTKCEETGFPMSWHTVVLWLPLQQSNTASPQSTASSEIHVALCKHQARNTHTLTHAGHLIHLSSSCWVWRPSSHHAETSQCISLIWTSVQKILLQQEEAVSGNQSR